MHHINEHILTSSENKDVQDYYYGVPVVISFLEICIKALYIFR